MMVVNASEGGVECEEVKGGEDFVLASFWASIMATHSEHTALVHRDLPFTLQDCLVSGRLLWKWYMSMEIHVQDSSTC